MACRHEHHEHGDHNHGDHHDHDHDHDGPDRGMEFSLYRWVDLEHVRGLNERVPGSSRTTLKPWPERLDCGENAAFVESDADDQLIIHIPFTGEVKLKAIALYALGDEAPTEMRAWINRTDVDFDSVESIEPRQTWQCAVEPPAGHTAEYPTKLTHFRAVRNLTLFFPGSFGGDVTRIYYIGLKGEYTPLTEEPVVTLYELNANPADHPVHAEEMAGAHRSIQ